MNLKAFTSDQWQMMTAMLKLVLQTVQFSREFQGILFDVFFLASMQGKRYALPPHAYVFDALVSWISQLDSATSVDTLHWKQYQTLSMDEKLELKKMCWIAKLFDPKMKKLVMCSGAGPEARALRSRLLQVLKAQEGRIWKAGRPPAGNLERLLCCWVEEMVSA